VLIAGVLALGWWRATRPVERPLQPLMRLDVDLGPDALAGQFATTAISPDGARLVFPAKGREGKQMLATRLLSENQPALLSGTENGRDPFFSPDGRWIGFFANGEMKKISVRVVHLSCCATRPTIAARVGERTATSFWDSTPCGHSRGCLQKEEHFSPD